MSAMTLQNAARLVGDRALYEYCGFPAQVVAEKNHEAVTLLDSTYREWGTCVRKAAAAHQRAMPDVRKDQTAEELYRRECIAPQEASNLGELAPGALNFASVVVYCIIKY